MFQCKVHDMSCNHCVMRITQFIHAKDGNAEVQCSIDDKTVAVNSSLNDDDILAAIRDAGYTPERI